MGLAGFDGTADLSLWDNDVRVLGLARVWQICISDFPRMLDVGQNVCADTSAGL